MFWNSDLVTHNQIQVVRQAGKERPHKMLYYTSINKIKLQNNSSMGVQC